MAPAKAHQRGKPDWGTPRPAQPPLGPGDFSGSFPLPTVGLDIYKLLGPACPQSNCRGQWEGRGWGVDRPEAEERARVPSPAPRGLHLQGGDVLVVELVLAVAQHQRRLPHAAFPEQHHLEGVGSACRRRRPAAGRSHPAAAPPPEPSAEPSPAPPPPRRPLLPGPALSRPAPSPVPRHVLPRARPARKSQNEGPRPPRQGPEARGELPLLPLMASPSSYVTLRVT